MQNLIPPPDRACFYKSDELIDSQLMIKVSPYRGGCEMFLLIYRYKYKKHTLQSHLFL